MVAVSYESGRLRELSVTEFNREFKRGFVRVVATRAGRLREWSQGELRLYMEMRYINYFYKYIFILYIIYKSVRNVLKKQNFTITSLLSRSEAGCIRTLTIVNFNHLVTFLNYF